MWEYYDENLMQQHKPFAATIKVPVVFCFPDFQVLLIHIYFSAELQSCALSGAIAAATEAASETTSDGRG